MSLCCIAPLPNPDNSHSFRPKSFALLRGTQLRQSNNNSLELRPVRRNLPVATTKNSGCGRLGIACANHGSSRDCLSAAVKAELCWPWQALKDAIMESASSSPKPYLVQTLSSASSVGMEERLSHEHKQYLQGDTTMYTSTSTAALAPVPTCAAGSSRRGYGSSARVSQADRCLLRYRPKALHNPNFD